MAGTPFKLGRGVAFVTVTLVCTTLFPGGLAGAEQEQSVANVAFLRASTQSPTARSLAQTADGGTSDVQGNTAGCNWPFDSAVLRFQSCATLPGGYKLNWNVTNGSVVTVGFSLVHSGWIGWGTSDTGLMVGSNVVLGYLANGSAVVVDTYHLAGKSPRFVQPPGQFSVAPTLKAEYVNGEMRLLTALQLQPNELQLSRLVWAHGAYSTVNGLRAHDAAYHGTLSFATGAVTQTRGDGLKQKHGVINTVGWGILLPLGAIVARYGQSYDPAWFFAHLFLQASGLILGAAGFWTGIVLKRRSGRVRESHYRIAIALIALSCLQVLISVVRPKKDTKLRVPWYFGHRSIGQAIIALGTINIFIGMHILNVSDGYIVAYSVVLGILAVATVGLEVQRLWGNKRGGNNHVSNNKDASGLLPAQPGPLKAKPHEDSSLSQL